MKCTRCESINIEEGISIGKTADGGSVGPRHRSGLFIVTEQMYCDICLDCGEIVRFFIKETGGKKWIKTSSW